MNYVSGRIVWGIYTWLGWSGDSLLLMHILGEALNEILTAADKNIDADSCRYLSHFGEDILRNAHLSHYFALRRITEERGSHLHDDRSLNSLRIFSLPRQHVVTGKEM